MKPLQFLMGIVALVFLSACGGGGGTDGTSTSSEGIYKEVELADVIQVESYYDTSGKTFLLTSVGYVYVLDTSDLNNDDTVTLNLLSGLSNITKISAGNDHLLALDTNGNVYGYGSNYMGQLALDRDVYPFLTSAQQLTQLSNIIDISAGNNFSVVVDSNGNVYSFGDAGCDTYEYDCTYDETQLGFYDNNDSQYFDTPIQIVSLSNIKNVDSGKGFSVAMDNNGDVYSFGFGKNGRLGQGGTANSVIPQKINTLANIKQVSVGYEHTLLLDIDNKLFGFGNGINGELSLGNYATDEQSDPIEITAVSDLKSVSAGDRYSLFLTNGGDVYSSGLNSIENRLGFTSSDKPELFNALKVPDLSGVSALGTGGDNSLFVDANNKVQVSYDPPVTVIQPSNCGDANLLGTWVRPSADKVSVTFTQFCTATIFQESINGYDATLTTYLTNVTANGSSMDYTISKMVYEDSSGTTTQVSGNSYTDVAYSISGSTLTWGGYTYTKI
ncbi:hypothetical protein [Sulfurimonas sp. HSL3-7]|uniref:RCC1 domain-containing protein n=1 Tax=Sulfonitrofixus jiaomeiensis TaxID=3131938 RepID=UPI0031F9BDF1